MPLNKRDQKEAEKARGMVEEAKAILETLQGAAQEKFDNMGEKAQEGERGEAQSALAEKLQEAVDACESAVDAAQEAIEME